MTDDKDIKNTMICVIDTTQYCRASLMVCPHRCRV